MLQPLLDPGLLDARRDGAAFYVWDETNVLQYFCYAEVASFGRLDRLTDHANMALAIAICEWIEAWLSPFDPDPSLEQYIEAGWAAMIDRSNTTYYGINEDDWRGPVRGPMVIAIGIINEIFFESHDETRMAFRSCYAINLARHVLGSYAAFETWLEAVIRRLERLHSKAIEGEPAVDILAPEFPKGALVARDAFVLASPYLPEDAFDLLRSRAQKIPADNPFFDPDASTEHQF